MIPKMAFSEAALLGSALEGEVVIDAHMHFETFYNFFIPRTDVTSLIGSARRIGIQRIYGSSLQALRTDVESGNAAAVALHTQHPDIVFPYIVFKPNYPELAKRTLDFADTNGIRRFKIHDDGNDLPYDHEQYFPLYEHAQSTQAVILVHTFGRKQVVPIMQMAARYPRIKMLLGHSGIVEENIYREAVRGHENIFLETCASMAWYGLIERLVAMAGAERVIFGTDMPFMSPAQQIGRVLFSKISDDDKRKVLGVNAQHIFA
jgi:predicted TIM-barrel fold metal-dependent hydrolase